MQFSFNFHYRLKGSFQRFRPSARDISSGMISSGESVSSGQFNSMVMQWGQLITHDVAKTTLLPNNCQNCGDVPGRCFSIPVGPFDRSAQVFGPCIRTARSSPQCQSSPRSQANENTAFIDGSPMYGSSEPDMRRFRDGGSGFMRVEFSNGGAFMPRYILMRLGDRKIAICEKIFPIFKNSLAVIAF